MKREFLQTKTRALWVINVYIRGNSVVFFVTMQAKSKLCYFPSFKKAAAVVREVEGKKEEKV